MPSPTVIIVYDTISAEAGRLLLSLIAFFSLVSARPGGGPGTALHVSRASLAGAMRHILHLSYVPFVATFASSSLVQCGVALREVVAPVVLRPCRSAAFGQGSSATALPPPSRPRPLN